MVRDGADAAIIRARLAHGERRACSLEVQLNRQGANKAQRQRRAGEAARAAALRAGRAVRSRRPRRSCAASPRLRRRFARQLLVQRTPRLAGVLGRLRPRAQAAQRAAEVARRPAGIRGDELSTLDIWDDKLVALGTEIIEARLALVAELAAPLAAAYARDRRRRPRARARAGRCRCDGADPDDEGADGCRAAAASGVAGGIARAASAQALARAARAPSSSAASRSSGRTATTSCCASTGCRSRATRATANRGRSRSRCGSPRPSCCAASRRPAIPVLDPRRRVRRARHRLAARGWPTLIGGYEQVLVTAAVLRGRARARSRRASCASRPGASWRPTDA